jgi:hypothetical protein
VSVSPSSPPPLTTWQRLLQVWAGQGEPPEESRLLRALVQAMATLGIGSVTVAALGVTPTSLLNLLAIPASALGATGAGGVATAKTSPLNLSLPWACWVPWASFLRG